MARDGVMGHCDCKSLMDCTGGCAQKVISKDDASDGQAPRVFSYMTRSLVLHFDQKRGTLFDLQQARRVIEVLIAEKL